MGLSITVWLIVDVCCQSIFLHSIEFDHKPLIYYRLWTHMTKENLIESSDFFYRINENSQSWEEEKIYRSVATWKGIPSEENLLCLHAVIHSNKGFVLHRQTDEKNEHKPDLCVNGIRQGELLIANRFYLNLEQWFYNILVASLIGGCFIT